MKYVNKLTPRLVPGRNGPKRRGRGRIPDEPIFLRQGDLDGACGYYCLLMALIALGLFRRSEVLDLDVRKPVKALARIRASARPHYFSGTGTKTLQKLLSPVKDALQVGITNGKDNKVRDFVVEHLARGDFVVLGMENVRQELAHWVLAVGMSGTRTRGEFKPTRFLLLDPDVNGPRRKRWNSAVDMQASTTHGQLRRVREVEGRQWLARFDGAVAIGLKDEAVRRFGPLRHLT